MTRVLLALAALLCSLAAQGIEPAGTRTDPGGKTVTIALVDTFPPSFYVRSYAPTLDYLKKKLPEYRFVFKEIDYRDVESGIQKLKPDFLVSSAITFASLRASEGAHEIAARKPAGNRDAAHSVFSLYVAPAGSPAEHLSDLKGRRIAVTDRRSFDGWLIAAGELALRGNDPSKYFSEVIETNYGIPDVASLVLLGTADAGVLSSCEYESLVQNGYIARDDLKILDAKPSEGGCARSSGRYPGAVISTFPWVPSEVVSDLTIAVLSMPDGGRGFRWVAESNFQPTLGLVRALRLGPYRYLRDMSPRAIWDRYRFEIILGFAFLLAVVFHIITINILVRKRTAELSDALETTRRLHEEQRVTRQKVLQLERNSIVSQLSSMFAHEIKQPIMNISLYAGALRMYLKKKGELTESADGLLKSLDAEVDRSSEIVEHVRSYAKHRAIERVPSDLKEIVAAALRTFSDPPPQLVVKPVPHAWVSVDPFEIQFIVANFVKNAESALEGVAGGEAVLRVSDEGNAWRLTVEDNGPAISDEAFERLGKAGASTKKDGLGFGLAIAVALAERNGGHLEFRRAVPHGLIASVILQKSEPPGEEP